MNLEQYFEVYRSIAVRKSPVQGYGAFTTTFITQGEKLFVWGIEREEFVVLNAQRHKRNVRMWRYGESLDRDCYIVDKTIWDRGISPKKPINDDWPNRVNHSCEPNMGLDGFSYVAMRDLLPGEELTTHYAFFDLRQTRQRCCCSASGCSGVFTGVEWRDYAFQRRYYRYMSVAVKNQVMDDLLRQGAWDQLRAIARHLQPEPGAPDLPLTGNGHRRLGQDRPLRSPRSMNGHIRVVGAPSGATREP